MTNIASIPAQEQIGEEKREYLIFVADSMASLGNDKMDMYQKLFQIGDHLLMGTGSGEVLVNTAMTMRQAAKPATSPKELAQEILNYTETLKLTKETYTRFFVGGMENGTPAVYVIGAPHTADGKPTPGVIKHQKHNNLYIDGSGSRFGSPYLNTVMKTGVFAALDTLAEGLLVAYDIAKEGSVDSGVNDKLQFGIISQNGISRLYHPDIYLGNGAFEEYLTQMTGVGVATPETPKERYLASLKRKNLTDLLDMVYLSLEHDLVRYSNATKELTYTAQLWSHNRTDNEHLNMVKEEKLKKHAAVARGAHALVTKGVDALIAYRNGFDAERRRIEEQTRTYERSESAQQPETSHTGGPKDVTTRTLGLRG